MSDYTLQVRVMIHRGKPETIAAVCHALHPLDRHRESADRRAAGKGGETAPSEEIPEIGADTPVPEVPQ